jgi:hypothetical protein
MVQKKGWAGSAARCGWLAVALGCSVAGACGGSDAPDFSPGDASAEAGGSGGASGSCTSSADCAARGLVCLVDEHRCVECLSRAQCAAGTECINNACRPGGAGGVGAAGGVGGSSGNGGDGGGPAGAGGTSIVDGSTDSAGTGGSGAGDAGCDPLDIVLLFDTSGSMNSAVGDAGGTKWNAAVASFLSWAGETRNVRVALQFHPVASSTPLPPTCTTDADCGPGGFCFPIIGCLQSGTPSCDANVYQNPRVPLSPLPSSREAFAMALSISPGGGSPLVPALDGAIVQARKLAAEHPTGTTIVVLIADGPDNSCSGSADGGDAWAPLAARAAAGLAGSPSIRTHVVAISSTLDGFDRVARAGGTTALGTASGDVGVALKAIQSAYPCP